MDKFNEFNKIYSESEFYDIVIEEMEIYPTSSPIRIEEAGKVIEMLEGISEDYPSDSVLAAVELYNLLRNAFYDITLVEAMDRYIGEYDSFEDYAMEFMDEVYGRVPDNLIHYIDYSAIARDLKIELDYQQIGNGIHIFHPQ